jgi:hypothetical protein
MNMGMRVASSGEQWRALYLFLWLVLVCRVHRLSNAPSFMTPKVRKLFGGLSFGYTTMPQDAMDTKNRVFLSAAVHILERSGIGTGYGQNERGRRLLSCSTSESLLKADVKELWLEGLAKGAADVAAGYPEHWWTGL